MNFYGADILSVRQFEKNDLDLLFNVARKMEDVLKDATLCEVLRGKVLGNLFFEPSTRSRVSFGVAFNRLGGFVRDTVGVECTSMVKGESLHDTAKIVGSYVDIIAIRHKEEYSAKVAAEATDVPVINGGDGTNEHPTQALLDLYTLIKERKQIDGLTVVLVGDLKYGRTVHSLANLLPIYAKVNFIFVSPDSLRMPKDIVDRLKDSGIHVHETSKLAEVIPQADVIYSTRIQEERFADKQEFLKLRGVYIIDKNMITTMAKEDVIIMHPLPRDNELNPDLDNLPNAIFFEQAKNGIPVRMSLFALLLGKEKEFI
jgi:aspartate carbamoyltransferase catalytic subunit